MKLTLRKMFRYDCFEELIGTIIHDVTPIQLAYELELRIKDFRGYVHGLLVIKANLFDSPQTLVNNKIKIYSDRELLREIRTYFNFNDENGDTFDFNDGKSIDIDRIKKAITRELIDDCIRTYIKYCDRIFELPNDEFMLTRIRRSYFTNPPPEETVKQIKDFVTKSDILNEAKDIITQHSPAYKEFLCWRESLMGAS